MVHRQFEPAGSSAEAPRYVVVLNRRVRALGRLQCDAARQPPVWSWQLVVGKTVVASGAASTFPKAKAAVLLAWKGCGPTLRARRPAVPPPAE